MRYIAAENIARAKEMDLLTYLRNYEPQELVHVSGNTYCTREHDSLRISNGKWCWFSQGIGGRSALDHLIKVKGIPFTQAAEIIGAMLANMMRSLSFMMPTYSIHHLFGASGKHIFMRMLLFTAGYNILPLCGIALIMSRNMLASPVNIIILVLTVLTLGYWLLGNIMLFIIVAVIWFCVRKKERIRRRAEYLMLIPVAYGLGHLCVLGFRTVSYSEWRDFQLILAIGILLYCAMLLALNIFYAGRKRSNAYRKELR